MRSLATCRLSRWVKPRRRYAKRAAVAGRFRPDDCWPRLQTLSGAVPPVDARRILWRACAGFHFPATASKIAIFGVVMRLFLYAPVGDSEAIRVVLAIIAFASIIFGNLMALSQTNIKRLLGYSSISHLGYLLVALIALQTGEMSMEAVGVYGRLSVQQPRRVRRGQPDVQPVSWPGC